MILILTHENSDFDAVASQWAAHRLQPEATPLLARRVNRNVHQYLTLYWTAFNYMAAEDWERRRVDRVLLVDSQSLPSLRGLKVGTPVQVIDHHTGQERRPDWEYYIEPVGAATTLLVEQIRAQGLALSVQEVTLFLLGIYEDSGSLTYDTTTPRDIQAAGWLLEQGADLATVRRFLQIPLTPAQQQLYHQLQSAAEWLHLEGHAILLAATRAADDFEDEISAVAMRLRDALVPSAMFLLVQLPYRIHLVARSSSDGIDVAVVARELGGGGHARAAAATVHSDDLASLRQQVLAILPRAIQPAVRVVDIMSHHIKTIPTSTAVQEAALEMQRYGHEGYPVVDEAGQIVGLLTRQVVDRTLNHRLGQASVRQVMKPGQVTVRPSDSVWHLQSLMLNEGWGQVPVVDDAGRLLGIVTRTDVLRALGQPAQAAVDSNLRPLLAQALPDPLWRMVKVIGGVADELGMPLYFVGGLVRDLLLGQKPTDLDMVVEGDAILLARTLAQRLGGETRTHARFGTAKWLLHPTVWPAVSAAPTDPDTAPLPEAIDFVTARTEFYTQPTVLPTVQQGSIKLDLHRRDFTINTLAVRLDGAHLGELLDFYGGRRDLEEKLIRVLHSLSFIDDPTRILRAVRFEQRLGFAIEPRTLELLLDSRDLLRQVTGPRIRHELELALFDERPADIMQRLDELGILSYIAEGLGWSDEARAGFARLPLLLADPAWAEIYRPDELDAIYFFIWMAPHPPAVQETVMDRLRVRKTTRSDLQHVRELRAVLPHLPAEATPATVEKQLRPYAPHPRALLAARALAADPITMEHLERYWREWRHVRTVIDGHALKRLGLKPGPIYQELLDALLAARLNGEVRSAEDEWALLEKLRR